MKAVWKRADLQEIVGRSNMLGCKTVGQLVMFLRVR